MANLTGCRFDGANMDQGNVKLSDNEYPKGLDLRAEDFAWMTDQLVAVANICCDGRVVSVLEGGYGELQHKDGEWKYAREPLALNGNSAVHVSVGCTRFLRYMFTLISGLLLSEFVAVALLWLAAAAHVRAMC